MAAQQDASKEQKRPKVSREQLKDALKIYEYIRPYRVSFIVGMILLVISSTVFMIFPKLTDLMLDIAQGKSEYGFTLAEVGYMLLGIFAFQGIVSYFRIILFAKVSENGIAAVRKALFTRLIGQSITFFEENKSGELISRLTADVEKLYNAFSLTLAEFLRQVIIFIVGILILLISDTMRPLAMIMLGVFPIIVIGAIFFGRYVRRLSKERQNILASSNNILNDAVTGISVVKSFANEWFERLRYNKSMDEVYGVSMKFAKARALMATFIVAIMFGVIFFIIWQGVRMVSAGQMDVGDLIQFVMITAFIGGSIAGLGNFYTELLGAIGATERVREILNADVEIEAIRSENPPFLKGKITMDNINFHYPTRTDIEVLKNLSLTVEEGQKVALVGQSGAGKSTILQLLLRFYDWQSGTVQLDGQDIRNLDYATYRNHFAVVPQEVILFSGTIKENLLYGKPDATEEEIIKAAKQANAWEFISKFPEKLETIVGERGVKLSGGQRQRIAIARAILKNPVVLLLDEATSSLDAESERLVQDALDKLMVGRTSIIVAHRLSTIKNVDCIYVLDDGKIVEQGTHQVLNQKEDGIYHQLAKLQFVNSEAAE